MNSSTIRGAVLVTKAAYDKYANYRDRKTREAYDALLNAADSYDDVRKEVKSNVTDLYDQSQERVSSLTAQARKRLDSAIADAAAAKDDTVKTVNKKASKASKSLSKQSKKAQKAARKAAQSAKKSATPKKQPSFGKRLFNFSLFTTLLAAVGAVVYYFLSKRDVVSTEPPRVEDFGADSVNTEESRLVYSTHTPVDGEDEHVASPEEGATERDEELLGSLEDQLKQHTDSQEDK
ncbi:MULTISPECIES: hypothetical protein [Corynebacterium]|uniref:Apolipoprotein A1/A4/E domain protein n=1 Tax=Corynebacterium ramonii TaxID=3026968 RepID=A0ABN4EBB8_9CORY|nr:MULTISPECIES: hypothetical protein [Corynebacterium]AIU31625.1 Hypothetical protein CulFRC11_0019 [Corynebacterium ramonii FRC0011]ESU59164.1 hypothetical protein D881_00555 [Corynebacterium ulcerans NCTC 12077]OAG70889.1 hypothetical protein AFK49_002980 [Corynebacterium ulcerans]STC80360.1 Uncharacterised protein [Corynebacterium ulcerans]